MPESLKVLRRRVRTIRNTKQITRAMEMVAAAKLRRIQGLLLSARPYVRHLEELVGRVAEDEEARANPYFVPRPIRRTTLVLYTADRGLCGSYNANVVRQAETFMRKHDDGKVELVCVGRRGHDYFRRRDKSITAAFGDFSGKPDREKSEEIAAFLCRRFLNRETDEVVLLYSAYVSTAVTRPTLQKFLPFDPASLRHANKGADKKAGKGMGAGADKSAGAGGDKGAGMGADSGAGAASRGYIFEPSRARVYERLVPAYLHAKIHISIAEALTSEHCSRMIAMNNASKNCDELSDTLTLRLNKARQGAITGDLLDIVGGAEALQRG